MSDEKGQGIEFTEKRQVHPDTVAKRFLRGFCPNIMSDLEKLGIHKFPWSSLAVHPNVDDDVRNSIKASVRARGITNLNLDNVEGASVLIVSLWTLEVEVEVSVTLDKKMAKAGKIAGSKNGGKSSFPIKRIQAVLERDILEWKSNGSFVSFPAHSGVRLPQGFKDSDRRLCLMIILEDRRIGNETIPRIGYHVPLSKEVSPVLAKKGNGAESKEYRTLQNSKKAVTMNFFPVTVWVDNKPTTVVQSVHPHYGNVQLQKRDGNLKDKPYPAKELGRFPKGIKVRAIFNIWRKTQEAFIELPKVKKAVSKKVAASVPKKKADPPKVTPPKPEMTYHDPVGGKELAMNYKRVCMNHKIDPRDTLKVLEAKREDILGQRVEKNNEKRSQAKGLAAVDRAIRERNAALEVEAKAATDDKTEDPPSGDNEGGASGSEEGDGNPESKPEADASVADAECKDVLEAEARRADKEALATVTMEKGASSVESSDTKTSSPPVNGKEPETSIENNA